jgi:ubiquinone biosynthesis protein
MMRQILRDGFFHGDPHPGNVLFLGGDRVAFIDCGNAVSIDRSVRDHLVSMLLAALSDEPQEVTDYLLLLGAASERTDLQQLTNDVGRMISYYSGFKSSAQIGIGQLLDQLLQMVLRHGVRMQPSLAAIAKSLVVTEGLCLGLDPNFDSQGVVRQEVQALVLERLHPKRLGTDLLRLLKSTSRYAQLLPRQVNQVLQRMQGGGLRIRLVHENIDQPLHRLDLMVNRISFAIVVAAIIMSSTNLVTSQQARGSLGDWLTITYLVIGILLGGWLLFSIVRSGRV